MAENNEPTDGAGDSSSDGKVPSQRRVFATKRMATPAPGENRPELEAKLASLVDSVKVLQSHFVGPNPSEAISAEAEPKARRIKRFQRSGAEEVGDAEVEPTSDGEERDDEAALNKNIAWPRLSRAQEQPASVQARGAAFGRKHPFVLWVLVQATGLGLLLLGYWLGQSTGSGDDAQPAQATPDSPAKAAATDLLLRAGINDRTMEAVGKGLRAEKAGNADIARATWEAGVSGQMYLPGAEYRLAMLSIEHEDLAAADIHLTNSLAQGEMMGSCYFVNAYFAGQKTDYPEAAKQFEHATRVDPFNARYLFCWGEALRRAGKTKEAVAAINEALDRPLSAADLDLFNFKLRLAKIESGQDQAADAELTGHLAGPAVTGDWLLLAAARDLSHAAFPAAAGHLRDAAHALRPDLYNLYVQDFAFQGYTTKPEVAALLKVPTPPPSSGPLDPGVWPAGEADPAVWRPFSPAL